MVKEWKIKSFHKEKENYPYHWRHTPHKLDTMQDLEQLMEEKLIRCESKQTMKQNAMWVSQR